VKSEAFWRVVARLSLQDAGTAEFRPANVEFRIEIIQSEPILQQRLFLRHSLFDILRFSASRGITLSRNLCTAADVPPSAFGLRPSDFGLPRYRPILGGSSTRKSRGPRVV